VLVYVLTALGFLAGGAIMALQARNLGRHEGRIAALEAAEASSGPLNLADLRGVAVELQGRADRLYGALGTAEGDRPAWQQASMAASTATQAYVRAVRAADVAAVAATQRIVRRAADNPEEAPDPGADPGA
jgi:hypothetical protein